MSLSTRPLLGVTCLVASLVFTATLARAQQSGNPDDPARAGRPRRPFRALFGGRQTDSKNRQALDLSGSLSGSYDDNVLAAGALSAAGGGVDPRLQRRGVYSTAGVALAYDRRGDRASVAASTDHGFCYYPVLRGLTGRRHAANATLQVDLSRRVTAEAGGAASYSPWYLPELFLASRPAPGEEPTLPAANSTPEYGVTARPNLELSTTAAISARLARRTTLAVDYALRQMRFTGENRFFRFQSAGARFSHGLTRNASLRLGYERGSGDYGRLYAGGVPIQQHTIDAGIDYLRPASPTRRTGFGFTTGSTVYTTPDRTYYRVLASGHVEREIGRSWTVGGAYRRGLQLIQGFQEPAFGDMVTATARGYASPRVSLQFDAGYSAGEGALTGGQSDLQSTTGRALLRYGLTSTFALSVQYLYYRYRLGPDFPLPSGMSRRLDRQTILVGLDVWVPLLR